MRASRLVGGRRRHHLACGLHVPRKLTRGRLAMRTFSAVLMFLCSALAPIFVSDLALAANVYFQKGEGGAGLDAWIELAKNNQLILAIMGCTKGGNKINASLGLYPDRNKRLSPELEKLRQAEDKAQLELDLCMNGACEKRQWKYVSSGFGDAFSTNISINQNHRPIRSLRVIIPNERRKYEYRGDVDAILRRVCRR
jgi:hypothetical protein